MDYNKIIILLIAIILLILVAGAAFLMNSPSKEDSHIVVVTDNVIHAGNTFLVKLADSNNSSIANENLTITVSDNSSHTVINKQTTTNDKGEVALGINNISSGNYTVNITFNGNDKYKECNLTYNLRVVNDSVEVLSNDPVSSDVDEGAFYSGQAGRTVYTGEVNLAPDGHHWKHMGNNEWVKID
ncbi:DUF3244 domain-containing protein [Methanobrevibacter sp.]|uniref:DUF3244 domain-containing protein n=1 Tax=Methanobrevibacter sp. TaxID=66852 RepID=UPI00388EBE31